MRATQNQTYDQQCPWKRGFYEKGVFCTKIRFIKFCKPLSPLFVITSQICQSSYLPDLEAWVTYPGYTCWGWSGSIAGINHRRCHKFISCPLPNFPRPRHHVGIVAAVVRKMSLLLFHIQRRRYEKHIEQVWNNSQKHIFSFTACRLLNSSSVQWLKREQWHLKSRLITALMVVANVGKLSCERFSIFDHLRLNLSHVMHAIFNIVFFNFICSG